MTTNGLRLRRCPLDKAIQQPSLGSSRRVRRPKDKEALMASLTQGPDSVFDNYVELMCFCACLGYSRKNSKPFDATAEPIAWSVFESRGKDAVVNLVAAVASVDFDIVAPDHFVKKLDIFESFANGGLEILGQLIEKSPKTSFDVVRELILEAQVATTGPKDSIDEFAKDLTWLT